MREAIAQYVEREDLPEQYREWLVDFGDSGYVARYRIDGDTLTILAVRHLKKAGFRKDEPIVLMASSSGEGLYQCLPSRYAICPRKPTGR
ncbi:hypothetical protein EFD55_30395 [Rhizobium pisi]|uniref:Uncharacterized protein n=2 Tax=Rhizobium pisi TaxID=574561 RepID=A0A427M8R6_9HYPH|nr:hypothetical protein EFD55_30395 [Rhizobium pisi]TCA47936.1 hypothetical protein E0J16_27290 [Rhizobium pisi]